MDRVAKAGAMTPINPEEVVGWGIDADPLNDPTYPMRDRSQDDSPGMNWSRPPLQEPRVEILRSIEHNRLPAALGTSTPPKGVSGAIRRHAFRFSESQWAHWLLLIFADRVNMVEGVVEDLGRARVPNVWKERGLSTERHRDPRQLAQATAIGVGLLAVALVAVRVLQSERRSPWWRGLLD